MTLPKLVAALAIGWWVMACSKPSIRAADPGSHDNLNAFLQPFRDGNGVPALGAAVVSSEKVIGLGVVGVRKHGDPTAATTKDKFHLGSDTKAMTAVLVALSVRERLLRWESTLPELFPELAPSMDSAYKSITVAELLAHRAGVGAEYAELWTYLWTSTDSRMAQRLHVAQEILKRAPSRTPGAGFEYTNFGYIIVGAILEKKSGDPWETLIQDKLFTPLDMASCGFGPPASIGKIDEPWGHEETTPVPPGPQADNPPALGPAGTVHCSLTDWAKFARLFLPRRGFLSSSEVEKLTTPLAAADGYALGLGVSEVGGQKLLAHDGSNTTFYARAMIVPAWDRAFVIASNSASGAAQDAIERAAAALMKRYRVEDVPAPSVR